MTPPKFEKGDMTKKVILVAILILNGAGAAQAKPKLKTVVRVAEHLAIGAGVQLAVSQAAGGRWQPGLIAAGAVAAFKEGTDALDGKDTRGMAALHALTILAGAGITAVATERHETPRFPNPVFACTSTPTSNPLVRTYSCK